MCSRPLIWLLLSCAAPLLCSCGEEFIADAPFQQAQDSLYLDTENWFYFDQEPEYKDGAPIYPFSYRIFDKRFEGFLLNSPPRIYALEEGEDLDDRYVWLDTNLSSGDTIQKFSAFRYQILLDRRQDDRTQGEIFYILRRTKVGMRSKRENTIWVVSLSKGILAAANYQLDTSTGDVSFDQLVGEPEYFNGAPLIRKLKYVDYHISRVVDYERKLIYKFDKLKGLLTNRDFSERKDLYEFQLPPKTTREWIDFKLELEENMVKLTAGDSCFYFSQQLDLQRSGSCR